jgi:hypothetical protein
VGAQMQEIFLCSNYGHVAARHFEGRVISSVP